MWLSNQAVQLFPFQVIIIKDERITLEQEVIVTMSRNGSRIKSQIFTQ